MWQVQPRRGEAAAASARCGDGGGGGVRGGGGDCGASTEGEGAVVGAVAGGRGGNRGDGHSGRGAARGGAHGCEHGGNVHGGGRWHKRLGRCGKRSASAVEAHRKCSVNASHV